MTKEGVPSVQKEQDHRAFLRQLVADQRAENERAGLNNARIFTTTQLISEFRESEEFGKFDAEAQSEFSVPHTQQELSNLQHRFAGGLFERLAYLNLAQAQTDRKILLSPDRTSVLFQFLYSDEQKYPHMKNPFGGVTMRGISIPDGVFVEEDDNGVIKITVICEYKAGMSGRNNPENSQLKNSLNLLKANKENFPDIFSQDIGLLIVSQSNSVLPTNRGYSMRADAEKIELTGLPFNNTEFRGIVDDFLADYGVGPKAYVSNS